MEGLPADPGQLRALAAKCRRWAAALTNESDVSMLRQTAAEYEAAANRLEHVRRPPRLVSGL
jgi:hypothetical protein